MASRSGDDSPGFRPDLEGLRAVAVLLVLLYHAGVPGIDGGYVGVDVFFVLSGFLITGLLIRELTSTGRVSLPRFYARRARRLLPASALCLLVTAILSAIILPPLRMPDVSADIAAAAAYVSNLRFAVQATDYLASELAPSPVLHFWSLGVEEQFYVFWPAMLALAAGAAFAAGDAVRGVRRVTVVLAVVFAASLALGVWLTGVQQPWAFFSLPTRAWELALGGLLAVPTAGRWIPPRLAPWLAWTGLGLVVLAGLRFDATTPFPGVAALVPTVGSGLVIAAGLGPVVARVRPGGLPSPAGILSLPPVRFIGRISYSLYLWHWPILVLPAAALGHLPGIARIGLAGLSIVVATASQRWVEEPIRHGRFVGTRPARVLALAGVATVVVFASSLGIGAAATTGLRPTGPDAGGTVDEVPLPTASPVASIEPTPSLSPGATPGPTVTPTLPPLAHEPVPADLAPTLAAARDDLPVIYSDGCHLQTDGAALATCAYGDTASATTVVLFGDSHAAQWFPALLRLSEEHGWRLVSLTKSACSSADIRAWSSIFNRPYTECDDWREQVFARIEAEHPALILLSNSSGYQLTIDGAPAPAAAHPDLWAEGLARTITRLKASASQVVLMGDTVRMTDDPPVCLSQHLDDLAACATPYARAVGTARLRLDGGVAASSGIAFIDPTPWQCFTADCPPVIGRFLVYRDKHHMTATYSRALASRLYDALPAGPAKAN